MKKTVTKVLKFDKNKEGQSYKDKNGKQFVRVVVNFDGDENQYSCLVYDTNKQREYSIRVGDEVDVLLEKFGEYWNFKLPTHNDLLLKRIEDLERAVAQLVKAYNKDALDVVDYGDDSEFDPNLVPF